MNETGLKIVMEAIGTVVNPDGTTQEIILRAERPLTDEEVENGDYSDDCRSQRGA